MPTRASTARSRSMRPASSPWRPRGRRRALRLDLEPQLRGAPGQGRTHAPHESRDGGGRRGDRRHHRRAPPHAEGIAMTPFTTLTAVAVPLDLANVDTDRIVPA